MRARGRQMRSGNTNATNTYDSNVAAVMSAYAHSKGMGTRAAYEQHRQGRIRVARPAYLDIPSSSHDLLKSMVDRASMPTPTSGLPAGKSAFDAITWSEFRNTGYTKNRT